MSVTSRSPLRMAGANINSGNLNTGEVNFTRGGVRVATIMSGAISMSGLSSAVSSGGHVVIFSGAGRVNSFCAHWPTAYLSGTSAGALGGALSGQPIVVYDATMGQRSGQVADLIAESGARPFFAWGAPFVVSGITGASWLPYYSPIAVDMPFFSGLCATALSGAPGFTISYSPETNQTNN